MSATHYPPEAPAEAGLLTLEQVSRISQLSRMTLYRIAADKRQAKRFGVVRIGGTIRFSRQAIEAICGKIEVQE
ncbi:MAG: helix-turn-helix domain-containing protein [Spirochaetia bacterium]